MHNLDLNGPYNTTGKLPPQYFSGILHCEFLMHMVSGYATILAKENIFDNFFF